MMRRCQIGFITSAKPEAWARASLSQAHQRQPRSTSSALKSDRARHDPTPQSQQIPPHPVIPSSSGSAPSRRMLAARAGGNTGMGNSRLAGRRVANVRPRPRSPVNGRVGVFPGGNRGRHADRRPIVRSHRWRRDSPNRRSRRAIGPGPRRRYTGRPVRSGPTGLNFRQTAPRARVLPWPDGPLCFRLDGPVPFRLGGSVRFCPGGKGRTQTHKPYRKQRRN